MEFTKGSIRVQAMVQKFLNPPFLVELDPSVSLLSTKVYLNNEFRIIPCRMFLKSTLLSYLTYAKVTWHTIKLNFFVIIAISLVRITQLGLTDHKQFEELGFYSLLISICTVALFSYQPIENHADESCYLLTQTFQIVKQFCLNKHKDQMTITGKQTILHGLL